MNIKMLAFIVDLLLFNSFQYPKHENGSLITMVASVMTCYGILSLVSLSPTTFLKDTAA